MSLTPCFFRGHEPILEQVRDRLGRVSRPHRLRWICFRCGRELGTTIARAEPLAGDQPAKSAKPAHNH
jgi:hypothetical protein